MSAVFQVKVKGKSLTDISEEFCARKPNKKSFLRYLDGFSEKRLEELTGIKSDLFYSLLTENLLPGVLVEIGENSDGSLRILMESEKRIIQDERSINFDCHCIDPGEMRIDARHQGQRIGSTILRNYIQLGHVIPNIDFFYIKAGLGNGAYSWARAGVPMMFSKETPQKITGNVKLRVLALKNFIDSKVFDVVLKLAKFDSTYDIVDIAKLDFEIDLSLIPDSEHDQDSPYSQAYIDSCVSLNYTNDEIKLLLKNEIIRLKELKKYCLNSGVKLTLGKFLLTGDKYQGLIEFKDPITMHNIDKYVGGFSKLEPVPYY